MANPHQIHQALGRVRRSSVGLPDIGDRTELDLADSENVTNREKWLSVARRFFDDGEPVDYNVTDDILIEFARRYNAVSDLIRDSLRTADLRTFQQLAKPSIQPAEPYYVIEWRIKTVNRDPVDGACGCGCGCACGG